MSHGASAVNLTFVVKEDVVADVIKKLHGEFFRAVSDTSQNREQ
ncbi:MAG TPA: hypothetical protein VNA22_01820 [Pyrinomonadaceae bacterium]|nr:hypothetical protein [Pyrinomonadaceae bacterium]